MTEQEKHEMVSYRLKRANETLLEVQSHVENELWATAINRLYYACFYAVSAMMLRHKLMLEQDKCLVYILSKPA